MNRTLDLLRPDLDATGLPWRTCMGKKHIKIFVDSRMVGILPRDARGVHDGRALLNVRAQIRRAARRTA